MKRRQRENATGFRIGTSGRRALYGALLIAVALFPSLPAHADPSASIYGGIGLVENRTARFMEDGTFALTGSFLTPNTRFGLTFQALPWLEGTFRYSVFEDFQGPDNHLYDRSFDVKVRLLEEGDWWPQIAVGVQDIVGTGVYGGEYIVASRRYYDFDFTLGLGWGRLGSRGSLNNPLGILDERFREGRTNRNITDTGQFDIGRLFRGNDTAIFGGIEWDTPLEGLKVTAEYSGDANLAERAVSDFTTRSPVNLALVFTPYDWFEGAVQWVQGSEFGIQFTFRGNPKENQIKERLGTPPVRIAVRTDKPQEAQQLAEDGDITLPTIGPSPRAALLLSGRRSTDLNAARIQTTALLAKNLEPTNPPLVLAQLQTTEPTDLASGVWWEDEAFLETLFDRLKAAAEDQKLNLVDAQLFERQATIRFSNGTYLRSAQAFGRMARLLTKHLPASIETFHLVGVNGGVPITEVSFARKEIERIAVARNGGASELLWQADMRSATSSLGQGGARMSKAYPRLGLFATPAYRQSLFDPDDPYRFQIYGRIGADMVLAPGLSVTGRIGIDIYNNFDEISRRSNSRLPHVRSDFPRYLQDGANGIDRLQMDYIFKPHPEIYGRVSAGIIDEFFQGAGGEILYRPVDARWAVSLNAYQAWQREYDKLFGTLDYETVTGHASFYWDTPFHGYQANLHAGRYLAGDWGGTLELIRRFDTGVQIGAFATLTDVPFDVFGEGSFDKGIFVSIPLEWISPFRTQRNYTTVLRPLTRDGGQRLDPGNQLYYVTQGMSTGELARHWEGFFD